MQETASLCCGTGSQDGGYVSQVKVFLRLFYLTIDKPRRSRREDDYKPSVSTLDTYVIAMEVSIQEELTAN